MQKSPFLKPPTPLLKSKMKLQASLVFLGLSLCAACTMANYSVPENVCPPFPIAGKEVAAELESMAMAGTIGKIKKTTFRLRRAIIKNLPAT